MIIHVGNARCRIENEGKYYQWLHDVLTVDTGRRSTMGDPVRHTFLNGDRFPTGLLRDVLDSDAPEGLEIQLNHEHQPVFLPVDIVEVPDKTYYPFQKEAIERILFHRKGQVRVATNGGKTVIMAGFLRTVAPMGYRAIIITHRKEIFDQLYEAFDQMVGVPIGRICAGEVDVRGRQFVVAMAQTLANRIGEDPDVTKLYDEHRILLADEAHHLQCETWQNIFLNSNAGVRVGFSGTIPDESTYQGWLTRSVTGRILIDVTNDELIADGISAKPTVRFYKVDSSALFEDYYKACVKQFVAEHQAAREAKGDRRAFVLFKASGGFYSPFVKIQFFAYYQRACIERGMIRNEARNAKLVEVIIANRPACNLVIVERLDHGRVLEKMLNDAGEPAVFISGESANRKEVRERFKDGKQRVLISSNIFDEGVDISGINVLVMAGVMKSERATLQRIGRGLRRKVDGRNEVIVVDIADKGNKYLESYSAKRRAIYEAEGFEVQDI